ncbi:MAG: helix-turn-helix domain-containing protein [Firmicutes bacterium]|nr:helix-turn-helix domain-containing protein [Bacillota bacterium]
MGKYYDKMPKMNFCDIYRALILEKNYEEIFLHYENYINKICTYRIQDKNGKSVYRLDEDKKQEIYLALRLALDKFKFLN